jgi:two-component system, LytTR family, sensor histidine kinase AlgZ
MHPLLADRRRLIAYIATWEILGILLALLLFFTFGLSWQLALAVALPLDAFYSFICLGAFWVCRAAPVHRSALLRSVVAQLAAAFLCATFYLLAFRGWALGLERTGLFEGIIDRVRVGPVLYVLFARAFGLYLLVAALHYLIAAFEASRQAETEALRFQVLSREAELRALRAQIHPHFLFNSLNSINALVTSQPEEARRLCLLLGDFLRRSLTLGTRERVPFSEELALAEDLLAIEKVRFGSRLRFESRVEEAARPWPVPPLVLQPLVENAVTHGIAQMLDGGTVVLEARSDGEHLRVTIENPLDADGPQRKGTGIGLANVRRRLDALYGREAVLRHQARGDSFRVELEIPADAEPLEKTVFT